MAALPDLATVDNLADALGIAVGDLNAAQAAYALVMASAEVRNYTEQRIDEVAGDVVTIEPLGGRLLQLPELPVTAVTEVTETIDGEATVLVIDVDYAVEFGPGGRIGRIRRLGTSWPNVTELHVAATVTVDYDHGYALPASGDSAGDVPQAIISEVVRIANRGMSNPNSLRQESIGRYSYTSGAEAPGYYICRSGRRALLPYRGPGL